MLTEMARMSLEDGLVMQIHPGSVRNHNGPLHARYGRDMGADIPGRTDYVHALAVAGSVWERVKADDHFVHAG